MRKMQLFTMIACDRRPNPFSRDQSQAHGARGYRYMLYAERYAECAMAARGFRTSDTVAGCFKTLYTHKDKFT